MHDVEAFAIEDVPIEIHGEGQGCVEATLCLVPLPSGV